MSAIVAIVRRLLEAAVALTLFGALLVTFVDVAGRYLFNRPLPGASDINGLAMGLIVFLALPLVTGLQEHIRIDLFDRAIGRVRPLAVVLGLVFAATGAAVLATMGWQLTGMAETFAEFGDRSPVLGLPLAPFAWAMAALAVLAAGIQTARAFRPRQGDAPE